MGRQINGCGYPSVGVEAVQEVVNESVLTFVFSYSSIRILPGPRPSSQADRKTLQSALKRCGVHLNMKDINKSYTM